MKDKAIEYNSKLQKVENALERMQKAGLNISAYNKLLDGIKRELEADKANNVEAIFVNMAKDVVTTAYNKAISKLDKLYTELAKYDIYLKTAGFCGSLRAFLISDNQNRQELPKYSAKILELLKEIRNSDTLDYEVEGPLVEDIYHLAYEFIKIEIRLTGASVVLNEINNNEIDISYIEKEVIRELESLNLREPKYKALVNKKYEIESEGLKANLANKDLIGLIVSSTISYEEHQKLLQRLTIDFETYYNKIISLDEEIKSKLSHIDKREKDAQNRKKQEYKEIGKQALRSITSIGVIISLAVSSFILSIELSKGKKSRVTTITHSTISEPVIEEQYVPSTEAHNSKNLYKYEPYGEKGLFSGMYSREVTEYNLTGSEDITLEELLKLDFESLGFVGISNTVSKSELSLSDTYKEAYYILKEVKVDEYDTIEELDNLWPLGFLLLLVVDYFINRYIIEWGLDKIFKESLDNCTIKECPKIIISSYRRIKAENKNIETTKKELKNLMKQVQKFIKDNEGLLKEVESSLSSYEDDKLKVSIAQKLERARKINY